MSITSKANHSACYNAYLSRAGAEKIQLELILNYVGDLALYPAFQAYFRAHSPPLLTVEGKNDPHFFQAGTLAYRRDLPHAEIMLLDIGHFALKTQAAEIGPAMRDFLAALGA